MGMSLFQSVILRRSDCISLIIIPRRSVLISLSVKYHRYVCISHRVILCRSVCIYKMSLFLRSDEVTDLNGRGHETMLNKEYHAFFAVAWFGPTPHSFQLHRQLRYLCTKRRKNKWERGTDVKRYSDFPVPSRDVTSQTLPGREYCKGEFGAWHPGWGQENC